MKFEDEGISAVLLQILESTYQELHKLALSQVNDGENRKISTEILDQMIDIRGKIIKLKLEQK